MLCFILQLLYHNHTKHMKCVYTPSRQVERPQQYRLQCYWSITLFLKKQHPVIYIRLCFTVRPSNEMNEGPSCTESSTTHSGHATVLHNDQSSFNCAVMQQVWLHIEPQYDDDIFSGTCCRSCSIETDCSYILFRSMTLVQTCASSRVPWQTLNVPEATLLL